MLRISFISLVTAIGFLAFSCQHGEQNTKIEIQLNTSWEFREIGINTWFTAIVPGSIAENIKTVEKQGKSLNIGKHGIRKANWEYRTKFDVDQSVLEQDVVQLNFKGFRAKADIFLNDSLIVRADNAYHSFVTNCKSKLKLKENTLTIRFLHNAKQKKGCICLQETNCTSGHFCSAEEGNNRLSNIGIFKPVYLIAWSTARISDIYLRPDSISTRRAVYTSEISVQSVANQNVDLEYYINNKLITPSVNVRLNRGENILHTKVLIDRPRLWWTNGLGGQNLYKLTVCLKRDQQIIYEAEQQFGVRTIELVGNSENESYFKLNGSPIFIKGASYVSPNQQVVSFERQKQIIESAKQSNLNLLRVTETIEDKSFYDLCDANGILVWQDVLACKKKLIDDSTYLQSFKYETVECVKYLRNHPCLALWFGNVKTDCKSMEPVQNEEVRKEIFQKMLPYWIKRYHNEGNYLSYLSISEDNQLRNPYSFNVQKIGNINIVSNSKSYCYLNRENKTKEGILNELDGIHNLWENPAKNKDAISIYVQKNFNKPKDIESEVFTSWIAQSEILKLMIESSRIMAPRCMGLVLNQLNDIQSKSSFGIMDSSGCWKPAQYTVSDASTHILVVPVREKDLVKIYVVSEALKDMDAILLARLIDFKGNDLFVKQIPIDIKANSSSFLFSIKESELLKKADKTRCCLVVQVNQASKTLSQNMLYFTELKNLYQPKASISFDINEAGKGYNLILRSPVLVKNLVISTDDKRCWFSDNNIDLLPDKRTKINIRYQGTKAQLEKSLYFWSLADLN